MLPIRPIIPTAFVMQISKMTNHLDIYILSDTSLLHTQQDPIALQPLPMGQTMGFP